MFNFNCNGIFLFSGPLTNHLAVKYGFRATIMTGCITASIGLLISSYATNIYWLLASYSIMTGELPIKLNIIAIAQ